MQFMNDHPETRFLGTQSVQPASPAEAQLDYVPNPRLGALYLTRFAVPEFTSLCPVTAQPDFAHLVIDYAPNASIVESKSLKLFLGSFRNHAAFHEDCTVGIGQRLSCIVITIIIGINNHTVYTGTEFWNTPCATVWQRLKTGSSAIIGSIQ